MIHAAYDQHVNRTSDFLISELKVSDDVDEARRRTFFVSANEAIKMPSESLPFGQSPLKDKRCVEWERYKYK